MLVYDCAGAKRDYLLCDYNRDGNSYRSPWSNKYDPPLKDGTVPSAKLRDIEVEGNNIFDVYRELYYEVNKRKICVGCFVLMFLFFFVFHREV